MLGVAPEDTRRRVAFPCSPESEGGCGDCRPQAGDVWLPPTPAFRRLLMNATFLPDWPTFLQFAAAAFVLAATPGPDMTLFVGRSISEGRLAGLACMLGALCGIIVHTTLVAVGLSALIVASPEAFFALKVVGAAYLLWLAWQAVAGGSTFAPDLTRPRAPRSLLRNWMAGFGIDLLNPKIILFFMTFLPQFVSASDPHASGKLFFLGLMFILLALPIVVPIVLMADSFARLLRKSPKVTRLVDWLLASVFSAFALRIIAIQTK